MKVVILAGGQGTRLAEETNIRPKPMVEIGGKPIILHIMNIYAAYGYKDFLVACGYKGEMIKDYFKNYFTLNSDYFVDLKSGNLEIIDSPGVDWRIGVIDTGLQTQTGGRILRMKKWINNETFMATYGDGLGDVNIRALVDFHQAHGKLATITAVHPPARFGELVLDRKNVIEFSEKPQTGTGWINGGFFIFEPSIFEYLSDDQTILERGPLEKLAADGQLMAFCHEGFWQPMDTLREKYLLEKLWDSGKATWKVWK